MPLHLSSLFSPPVPPSPVPSPPHLVSRRGGAVAVRGHVHVGLLLARRGPLPLLHQLPPQVRSTRRHDLVSYTLADLAACVACVQGRAQAVVRHPGRTGANILKNRQTLKARASHESHPQTVVLSLCLTLFSVCWPVGGRRTTSSRGCVGCTPTCSSATRTSSSSSSPWYAARHSYITHGSSSYLESADS